MTAEGRLTVSDLDSGEFETVIIAGIDLYGRLCGRRVPVRRWKAVADEGINLCSSIYAWDFAQEVDSLQVAYTGAHTGWHDFRLVPDVRTLRRAAWLEGTAIVLADSVEEHTETLVPVAPRTILRETVNRLDRAGHTGFTATELEFHLYHGAPAELRAQSYHGLMPTTEVHADYKITEGDLYETFFRQLRTTLEASGIPIEIAQAEYGPGQWEINLEYAEPLEMADRHALFKHVVHHVAAQHGMTATFMARPLTEGMSSSCHVHVSLRDQHDRPVFHDPAAEHGEAAKLRHAIGGVLDLAPEFLLWYAPTVNSMRRLMTQDFAGNGLTWGFDNRTTSARIITGGPNTTRLEWRLPGADVNPYLTLAAVLASAQTGIDRRTEPGRPISGDGYAEPDHRLRPALHEASSAFRASATARGMFGDAVIDHYADLADHEWSTFLHAVTDWERVRYFDSI